MNKVTIAEALALLEDGNYHSVAYVSADSNKHTGGKIIRLPHCQILSQLNTPGNANANVTTDHAPGKSQRHSIHATRNLRLKNGMVRKMHIYTLFLIDNLLVL